MPVVRSDRRDSFRYTRAHFTLDAPSTPTPPPRRPGQAPRPRPRPRRPPPPRPAAPRSSPPRPGPSASASLAALADPGAPARRSPSPTPRSDEHPRHHQSRPLHRELRGRPRTGRGGSVPAHIRPPPRSPRTSFPPRGLRGQDGSTHAIRIAASGAGPTPSPRHWTATMDRPGSDRDSVLPDLAVWGGICVIYGNSWRPCSAR